MFPCGFRLLWACVGIACLGLFGGFVGFRCFDAVTGCICLRLVAGVLSLCCYCGDCCLFVLRIRCFYCVTCLVLFGCIDLIY